MSDYVVKDSGERRSFDTGAVRDKATGKGRFDLIPAIPLMRLAAVYEKGSVKYDDRNWEKGIPTHNYIDSAFRHLVSYVAGDDTEDHLSQCVWNIFGYQWTVEQVRIGNLPAEIDTYGPCRPGHSQPPVTNCVGDAGGCGNCGGLNHKLPIREDPKKTYRPRIYDNSTGQLEKGNT